MPAYIDMGSLDGIEKLKTLRDDEIELLIPVIYAAGARLRAAMDLLGCEKSGYTGVAIEAVRAELYSPRRLRNVRWADIRALTVRKSSVERVCVPVEDLHAMVDLKEGEAIKGFWIANHESYDGDYWVKIPMPMPRKHALRAAPVLPQAARALTRKLIEQTKSAASARASVEAIELG